MNDWIIIKIELHDEDWESFFRSQFKSDFMDLAQWPMRTRSEFSCKALDCKSFDTPKDDDKGFVMLLVQSR
jgi:hypothetical protein